jgi:ribosomal-protein-alanine N-acetyltransferase
MPLRAPTTSVTAQVPALACPVFGCDPGRRVCLASPGRAASHDDRNVRMSSHPQVRLIPATVPLLTALNDDLTQFDELIGSPVPEGWPEFPEAIGFTLAHIQNAPEAGRSWSMQFFVDHATGRLVGSGGFAAPPVERTVEIGYEVAPEFRGLGFGVAAARALVAHAVASGEVDHVIAHTLPGPNPSTGVLVSLGFGHVDDQEDPDVGVVWEWRWTRLSET